MVIIAGRFTHFNTFANFECSCVESGTGNGAEDRAATIAEEM